MSSTGVLQGGPGGSGAGGVAGPFDGGLGVRLGSALAVLSSVVADLEPARLGGADARALYASFVMVERLAVGAKALLAPRIDATGIWRDEGFRDAASFLAAIEGVPPGHARSTLDLGRQLDKLPDTEDALRQGKLSRPKAAELVEAAADDPASEAELLEGAAEEPFFAVRDRCRRAKAASSASDPEAAVRRAHAARSFTSWSEVDGSFHYKGSDTAERGAQILRYINSLADGIRRQATRANSPQAHQPQRALAADAFFALVTRPGPGTADGDGDGDPDTFDGGLDGDGLDGDGLDDDGLDGTVPGSDTVPGGGEPASGTVPTSSASDGDDDDPIDLSAIVNRPPTCSATVVVDLAALVRGSVEDGETCEIQGIGPIPVSVARSMMSDSFLRFLFTEDGDIRAVSHPGRTINQKLRTALAFRDRGTCVVPGCGTRHRLEIDHVVGREDGGLTELDNLCLLCHHHHFLKTHEGWTLTRSDANGRDRPTWAFEPQPAFGQEPDLGYDTDEAKAERRRRPGSG